MDLLINMLVSIITATYNSAKFIESTYHSIYNQNYQNWEWIVTDDCSTDNTLAILESISSKDSRVKIYRNKVNGGAAVSRNNSIEHASGEYVAFIDSDDLWLENKLEKQLDFMITNNVSFSFTAYEIIDELGRELKKTIDTQSRGFFDYTDLLVKKVTLGCSTVMLNASLIKSFRMPLIRTGQDYAFWLKILKNGNLAYILPSILTKYRVHSSSISRNKFKKAIRQWYIYRNIESLSFIYSVYCFSFYAFRAVFRTK